MIEMKSYYDAADKKLRIDYKTNLIRKYKSKLLQNIKEADLPKNTKVEELDDNRVIISIPMEVDESTIHNGVGRMDADTSKKLTDLFNDFVTVCLNQEVRTTEIIPLEGYPLENLKEDIKAAISDKRNFCVIDTFDNYKKFNGKETISLNQVKYKYLSNEYCNLAIEIECASDLSELQKKYSPLLVKTDWI